MLTETGSRAHPESSIEIIDINTLERTALLKEPGVLRDIMVSPGNSISAGRRRGGGRSLIVEMDQDGTRLPHSALAHRPYVWLREVIGDRRQIELQLWARSGDYPEGRRIAPSARFFSLLPAPGSDYFCVDTDLSSSSPVATIMDARGSVIARCPAGFFAAQWSPDSKYILGWVEKDADMAIGAADLAVFSISTESLTILTDTPRLLERLPAWNVSARRMAFHDHATGEIHLARF